MTNANTMTLAAALDLYDAGAREALMSAVEDGWTICKFADPVDGARDNLTVQEALTIAREDAGLIFFTR